MSATQRTLYELVVESARDAPRALPDIYNYVALFRPNTAKETIRARIYENLKDGRILRVAEGVYVAVDGPARLVMVEGDAWEVLRQLPDESINALVTDQPYDLGTKQHVGIGTTRPHADIGGRTYDQRDLDRDWFTNAFRILKKDHGWRNLKTGEPRAGGGACIVFSPNVTRHTWPHIKALIELAENCGFQYHGAVVWNQDRMGMGYSFGRSQHQLAHLFTAGDRNGVGWDLAMRNVLTIHGPKNACKGGAEEHEAEKPVELFQALLRFCTRAGDVILDPFAGRARWARQAVKEGRHVILVEKEGRWLDKIATEDWS